MRFNEITESSPEDRFKKYIRPVVKTTPKIEKDNNPSGRTTDHVEWKVTTPTGEIHRYNSKKQAQEKFDSFGQQDVAEGIVGDMYHGAKHGIKLMTSPSYRALNKAANASHDLSYSLKMAERDDMIRKYVKRFGELPGFYANDPAMIKKFLGKGSNNITSEGVEKGDKKPYPKTWHDVDPKLGKQVDKMSQAEKVKKGLAHPNTLKKSKEQGVAEGAALPPEVIELIKKIAQSSATPEHKKAMIDALVAKHSKQGVAEGETWSKHNNKRAGGMSKKSVASYRRSHPGSKIQTAVTTKPSKLKKGSKAAKRRASFCARMRGMKKHRTGAKTANDPNSNINKSLRRWHCESIEELQELVMLAEQFIRNKKNEL
jgi:hypothetical protein